MSTMATMAYGDGTVTQRRDGRLQVVVTINGKRMYRTVPARLVRKDPKAARELAKRHQRELQDRRDAALEPSGQTVADYLRSWIDGLRNAKHQRVRPRTLDHYAMIVERHIVPALGRHRLDRLNERHIQAWIDSDQGSPQTVQHHRAVLRRGLNIAYRQRLIPRNPALNVELPRVAEFVGNPLSFDEARRLFAATRDDRLGAFWRLAVACGAREAELAGLGWDDLDLDAGTVRIHSQLQRIGGSWVRSAPKSDRTVETIALDRDTVAALRRHRDRQARERTPAWRYFGLVFTTTKGEPIHNREVLRYFHEACDRAGIARRRIHDLRGSSATLMREIGVPKEVRMARLGHSTDDMAEHYGRARIGLDREAVDALGDALRGAK